MKFTVMVLNGITSVGKHLSLNLDFESFIGKGIIGKQYDLPNLVVTDHPFDNTMVYNGRKIQVRSEVSEYLKKQMRTKSDTDFFGLFGTEDTLEFSSPIGIPEDTLEIFYNVKRKSVKEMSTDFLFVIDNETSQISNEGLINQIFSKVKADDKFLITTNSDLSTLKGCNVELIDVDL